MISSHLDRNATEYSEILIGCVYRAPDESLEVFDYLDNVVRDAAKNSLEVIVIGDLNCDIFKTSRHTERLPDCYHGQ